LSQDGEWGDFTVLVSEHLDKPINALVLCPLGRGYRLDFLTANKSAQMFSMKSAPNGLVQPVVKDQIVAQHETKKLLIGIPWSQVATVLEVQR